MNPILRRHFFAHITISLLIFAGAVASLTAISVNHVKQDASEQCKTVACLTARMIHANYLEDFKAVARGVTDPKFQESYTRIHNFISTIKSTYKNLTFLYTFRFESPGGEDIMYMVDAEPQESPEFSAYGIKEKSQYPPFKIYYRSNFVPIATHNLMYDSKWGWFISGYAPIWDDNSQIVGHVAADIGETTLNAMIYEVMWWCLAFGGGGGFLLLILGWATYILYNTKQNKTIQLALARQADSAKKFMDSLDTALVMPQVRREELQRQVIAELEKEMEERKNENAS